MEKLNLDKLEYLVDFLIQNKERVNDFIKEFGEISYNNGYGTLFLEPRNDLFRVFWINVKNDVIESMGFGGPDSEITLEQLYSAYPNHREGFSIYDDLYEYVFYKSAAFSPTIKITSRDKLFKDGVITQNVPVYGFTIHNSPNR